MVSKLLRRQLQVVLLITIALTLLVTSAVVTITAFSAWHFLATRPYHEIPMSFHHVQGLESKPATLEATADLKHEKLLSVAGMDAEITVTLPESPTNLDNSVFQISSYLLSSDEVCVAHASSTATLTFRSSTHGAARAIVLFLPMLLGITREYQTVSKLLFRYSAVRRKGILPNLVAAKVKIHSSALQIESAQLILRVRRTGLLTAIFREGRLSTLTAFTVGIWYCMLVSCAAMLACASATRRAIIALADAVLTGDRGLGNTGGGVPRRFEGNSAPRRQIRLGHGDKMGEAEIGHQWGCVYGFR